MAYTKPLLENVAYHINWQYFPHSSTVGNPYFVARFITKEITIATTTYRIEDVTNCNYILAILSHDNSNIYDWNVTVEYRSADDTVLDRDQFIIAEENNFFEGDVFVDSIEPINDTYISYFGGTRINPYTITINILNAITSSFTPSNYQIEKYTRLGRIGGAISGSFTPQSGYTFTGGTPTAYMGNIDLSSGFILYSGISLDFTDGNLINSLKNTLVDDNIVLNITAYVTPSVNITNNLTNVSNNNPSTTLLYGNRYLATLSPVNADYHISSVSVSMGDVDVTNYYYNNETGIIDIPNVTGDVVINARAVAIPSISYNLTGVTSSNTDTSIDFGDEYTTTITPLSGYTLDDISILVTMGGVEQFDVYDNGVITIPSVTDDLIIVVIANTLKTFEFRSMDGNALYLSLTLARITTILFTINNNTRILTINGIPHSWTQIIPTDKELIGLSLTVNSTRYVIPVGVELQVNYNQNTTFYETIVDERPEVNSFSLMIYKNKAESNRVDKSSYLTYINVLEGTLRGACEIISPVIRIEYNGVVDFNYVYIPIWNRYYFVSNVRHVVKNIIDISLKEDVLMSHKDAIYLQKGLIARNEYTYNEYLVDNERIIQDNPVIDLVKVNSEVFTPQYMEENIMFNVIGGK